MLRSNEKQFRGGLVFKARRLVVSLNSRPRVMKEKKEEESVNPSEVEPGYIKGRYNLALPEGLCISEGLYRGPRLYQRAYKNEEGDYSPSQLGLTDRLSSTATCAKDRLGFGVPVSRRGVQGVQGAEWKV